MSNLQELVENYNQAFQNFNWADEQHRSLAICELIVAEEDLSQALDERQEKPQRRVNLDENNYLIDIFIL